MSAFHFFTNLTFQTQTIPQRYGPVQNNEALQYRVTSLFSSSTVQKAYAVCNGKIFAQEVNGKINIVLKPTQQPTGIFAPAKYYIYKGLMKDFLVASDGLHIADVTRSELTLKIKLSQDQRNAAYDKLTGKAPGTTKTLPSINSVGLNLTASANAPDKLLDTAFLDEVFLRVDEDEFPMVSGGDDIGQFDYENFGFEIILDGLGEGPSLRALRNTEMLVTVDPSPSGDVKRFKAEDEREQILNYIDPCAFYSSFFFDAVNVKLDSSDTKFVPRSKEALYNEVLARFLTRDVVYLDLRNEHNHGFNYYRNYNLLPNDYAQFFIKYDAGSSDLTDYQSSGWPIFAIPTSAFTSTNAKKPSTIVLNLPQGDNPAPMIYRNQGYFFTGFKRTNQRPDVKEILRTFIGFQADSFTEPIAFSIPKLADNTTIPSYISVRYLKKISSLASTNPPVGSLTLKAEHFIDNLFELTSLLDSNGLTIPLNTNDITQFHVTGSTAVVDSSSGYGRDYVAKIGIGRDLSNVYFFACLEAVNIATGSSNKTSFPPVLSKAHKTNVELGYLEVLDGNNVQQPIVTHSGLGDGIFDTSSDLSPLDVDERSMVMLALDKDELPPIQNAMNSLEAAFDKRLALRNKHDFLDNNGNVMATEYDLFVVGYQFGSFVSIESVSTNIKMRTRRITPRIFSSREAALNFEGLSGVAQNRKHFARSKMQLDVDYGIRNIFQLGDTLAATSKGTQWEFSILGKKRVFDSTEGKDFDWYFVELQQDIPSSSPYPSRTVVNKGQRRWIRADQDRFYPVASFEKFITDLAILNDNLDAEQIELGASLDSLSQRITRLRQMTKELTESGGVVSISKLFDEIIGSSATSPPGVKRLDDIGYLGGTPESLIDDFQFPLTVDTEIQLFRDYMGVEFGPVGSGVVVDLHHLLIGLDVLLFHANPDKYINPFVMVESQFLDPALENLPQFFHLGSNVDMSTWAGDIGAAPADYLALADPDYRNALDPQLTEAQRQERLWEHFYKTRAKDDDLYPDVYAHSFHKQLMRKLQRNNGFRNVTAAFYYFNLQLINEGDREAFRHFTTYLKLDPNRGLLDQPDRVAEVLAGVMAFAHLWWIRNNPLLAASAYISNNPLVPLVAEQLMLPLGVLYSFQFLRWLQSHQ